MDEKEEAYEALNKAGKDFKKAAADYCFKKVGGAFQKEEDTYVEARKVYQEALGKR